MKDKAPVGADLYIEDSPSNIQAFRSDGHRTIIFSNSTNRTLPGPRANTWQEVVDLVKSEMDTAGHPTDKVLAGE
jgi:beta-phosphoglucomutase-like phosphatase (HAD superfamily)